MQRWRRALIRVAVYLAVYLGACFYLAGVYIHPHRDVSMVPKEVKEVQIESAKGPVPSWATPRLAAGAGGPVVFVLAYGYGGNRSNWIDVMRKFG